jgi:hypothetical protein
MVSKRIRTLLVELSDRETIYVANKPRDITIDGLKVKRTITNIELVGDHFELYISNGAESRHWKDIPKNNKVTVEYYID